MMAILIMVSPEPLEGFAIQQGGRRAMPGGRTVDRPLCLNAMSHPDSSRCPTFGQARANGSRTAPSRQFSDRRPFSRLWSTSSSSTSSSSSSKDDNSDVAPAPAQQQAQEVSTMRSGDIRQELESYGISTKSFLEKKELVTALEQARAEGKKPIQQPPPKVTTTTDELAAAAATAKKKDSQKPDDVDPTTTSSTTKGTPADGTAAASDYSSSTKKTSSTASSKSKETTDRAQRMAEEMKKANAMKVGELKKTLQEMGISTKSMFEKTEFVTAYAEAIVNGVMKKQPGGAGGKSQTTSSSSSKGSSSTGTTTAKKEEPYDPEYRTEVMQKMPRGDPRMLQGVVIDVTGR
jgi:hypothetical protein